MVIFGKSRPEKYAKQTMAEDNKGAEEKPAWYETWRGGLSAIISLFFLVNRISVSNCFFHFSQ
jgi:hypothetical protein